MITLYEESAIHNFCITEFQKHFDKKIVDMSKRLRLVSDLFKFKIEDKYFYNQKTGKIPRHYSLYFDNEFVCAFDSSMPPEVLTLLFLRGITKLYEEGKIEFDKNIAKEKLELEKYNDDQKKEEKKRKIKKTIDSIKSANLESQMAAQVIDSLQKDAIA